MNNVEGLKKAEAALTAAAGYDHQSMSDEVRNHVIHALEEVQDHIEEVEEG